ncbi:MAG TPA: hypothetical protein PLT68_08640 [Actinomycetota bacterium]|nr:hypothetical protein [Actinomycetota bacterium]
MRKTRTAIGLGAVTAIAGGSLLMGAGAANAASDPDFRKVSAPQTVTAGQMFRLKCQMKRNVDWSGAQASLLGKRVAVNAKRPVSASGNCGMRVVLTVVGTQKIRVVVTQNLGAVESKWLRIKVLPA